MITTLRIKKLYKDKLDLAVKWYSVLSILNDFEWSPMEIKLMAFTAVEGNISSGGKREKFCTIFDSTKNSIANSIGVLGKKFHLFKKDGKLVVHPQLYFNFDDDLLITLSLEHEAPKSDN